MEGWEEDSSDACRGLSTVPGTDRDSELVAIIILFKTVI